MNCVKCSPRLNDVFFCMVEISSSHQIYTKFWYSLQAWPTADGGFLGSNATPDWLRAIQDYGWEILQDARNLQMMQRRPAIILPSACGSIAPPKLFYQAYRARSWAAKNLPR